MGKIEHTFKDGDVLYANQLNPIVNAVNDNADQIADLRGMTIENVQIGTIEAQSNHYYNVTEDVDTLAVTLPAITPGKTSVVKVHFIADEDFAMNIDGGDVRVVYSANYFKPFKEYVLTIAYNGSTWNVTAECLTPADCLTFHSAGPFSITILRKGWDGSFEYSSDGNTWHAVEVNTSMESADNGTRNVLYLRGHGNSTISKFTLVESSDMFMTMEGANIHCVGDIRTLLNYKDAATATMSYRSFWRLFDSCTALISAPELPSLIMAEDCYRRMFHCTGITIAPELPATTLAYTCYDNMFGECAALVSAPRLPATTLADGCYAVMFGDCTALVNAPELHATTLAESCYQGMFDGCTALVNAPELPATTLVKGCYGGMFRNCTALVNAPALIATTLAEDCYREMFLRCSGLITAPEISATAVDKNCCNSMFAFCTALVNAPSILPAMVLAQECYRSMFNGCTALTSAPELPATTLAESCYRGMFIDCKITTAPVLPATTLAKECYRTMFQRCTLLSVITMLATDISATDCLLNWVNVVAVAGTFTKDAAMQTLPSGPSGIPTGWEVVNA